jgi:hypothetical protein
MAYRNEVRKKIFFLTTRPIKYAKKTSSTILDFINYSSSEKIDKYGKYTARPKFYSIRPIVEISFNDRANGDYKNI